MSQGSITIPKQKRGRSEDAESFLPAVPRSIKKPRLLVEIPTSGLNSGLEIETEEAVGSPSSLFSADSLFDDIDDHNHDSNPRTTNCTAALRSAPPVPGLFFEPTLLLPSELAETIVQFCMRTYFQTPGMNQVMLFGRFIPPSPSSSTTTSTAGLPQPLLSLLSSVSSLLHPVLPPEVHELLFPAHPTKARQAIINLYVPGEGITPHVDLLGRYADGIVGVSFGSGCVMRFDRVVEPGGDGGREQQSPNKWELFLPERSIIVLSEDARYKWTHGIEKKTSDYVAWSTSPSGGLDERSEKEGGSWIDRGTRLSVTFRWLLPGADVVGE